LFSIINPATQQPFRRISDGSAADANKAVAAAKAAFPSLSQRTQEERKQLLNRNLKVYSARFEVLRSVSSAEVGAPLQFARNAQAWSECGHSQSTIESL
jgi:aldehyde dehydrogenase (NAD+)